MDDDAEKLVGTREEGGTDAPPSSSVRVRVLVSSLAPRAFQHNRPQLQSRIGRCSGHLFGESDDGLYRSVEGSNPA